MKRRLPIVLMVLPLVVTACKKKVDDAPPPALPATSAPAASQPVAPPAEISVSDQVFTFAPAKLVLRQNAVGITATLYSEGTPNAAKGKENSFRFVAEFDAESPADVSGQQFVWKNSIDDLHDVTSSISLNDHRQTVQPLDATLSLTKTGGQWTATIAGRFQYIDDESADDKPVAIHVTAEIVADQVDAPGKL